MARVFLLALLTVVCTSCQMNNRDEAKLQIARENILPKQESNLLDERTREVIEDVLNLEDVRKYSQLEYIEKHYENIYVQIKDRHLRDTVPVVAWGHKFILLGKFDAVDTSKEPCFIFTKIKIDNDTAAVQMIFEMTGALVSGQMFYLDDRWVPGNETLIGRM